MSSAIRRPVILLAAVGPALVLLPSVAFAQQPFISKFTHVSTNTVLGNGGLTSPGR
jgi:hypothetical protein